jgi:hypothetical protein
VIDIHSPKTSRGLAIASSWMNPDASLQFMQAVKDDTLTKEQLSWIDDPLLIPEDQLSNIGIIERQIKIGNADNK